MVMETESAHLTRAHSILLEFECYLGITCSKGLGQLAKQYLRINYQDSVRKQKGNNNI